MNPWVLPRPGSVHDLSCILMGMELPDSPCLVVNIQGIESVIQYAHVSYEQLLSIPGIGGTLWEFERVTHEHIPVFHFAGSQDTLKDIVDIQENKHKAMKRFWVTPKGFPRIGLN